jgi:uncharacterized protein (TIGR02599 family)
MKTKLPISDKTGAFTLIEVMVSMVIVLILVLVFSTMTDRTAKIWRDTRGKVSQFQQARDAFDLITRNLSQATLNTYLDYYDAKGARREAGNVATFEPSRYGRYSDLRFVTGKASQILGLPEKQCPSQALFFYAPLGETGVTANTSLNHLLNLVGYYISYDADTERPNFMPIAQGYGFRLMELRQRSESLTMPKPGLVWPPAVTNHPDAHIVARNIVALTFLPKLAETGAAAARTADGIGQALAPNYQYDSHTKGRGEQRKELNSMHQLPPIVEVTMVAIDQDSAERLGRESTPPDFGLEQLFQNADPDVNRKDLETLLSRLTELHINARVFRTEVALKGAKWSHE